MSEDSKEEVVLDDLLYHEHPLILRRGNDKELCSGCRSYISPEDTAYRCRRWLSSCGSPIHEECAEMPREIRLSIHPQHTLIQKRRPYSYNPAHKCAVCDGSMSEIGYRCSDYDSCEFRIHLGCAQNAAVVRAAAGGDRSCIDHLSHPQHRLTLLWRPGRSASIRCDACATIHKGNSYLCIECQYCINESCAALLETTTFPHHHHHPLSLAYHLPQEYIKSLLTCGICYKDFLPKYWLYHCRDCRYAVHINCAIASLPTMSRINLVAGNAVKGFIAFPMEKNKVVEELILPYVTNKLGGKLELPMDKAKKHKFHNHDHELSLISSSSLESEKENHENSDDDDLNTGITSELVCDGCTLPIHHKQQLVSSSSSSSSSSNVHDYYMSCSECKYFLHWACFHFPPELPSHPLHLEWPDHNLTLETSPKLEFTYCRVCRKPTNGLFYRCTKCDFKLDIKCASLPDTIKHAAHPQHRLKLLSRKITGDYSYRIRYCSACNQDMINDVCYKCDICRITLHASCIVMPAAVSKPSWDKHQLHLVSNDCSENNPIVFYCDICENNINHEHWMYHCHICDFSLHPGCFPTASGDYQNIKFGQRYAVAAEVHHHTTLVYQLRPTSKLRCDVCKTRAKHGFQCDSHKCDFFMCLYPCGFEKLKKPVDRSRKP